MEHGRHRPCFFLPGISFIAQNGHVGTAARGCPVERSSTGGADTKNSGASLRRTAEGGCPHVNPGN